jgi:hypothetical protein
MTTVTRPAKSRLFHKLIAAAVLVAGLGGVTLASAPAQAHDGWYGERWRGHEWREHAWRERYWARPYGYGYGYYAPPVRYYYPPPAVVYAPPPRASFNVVVPFR